MALVVSFDGVVDEYDSARPSYPDGVYEALGPLDGVLVVEGGAGTGLATRALIERGAHVIPFDAGVTILARAARRTPDLTAVVADGAWLPFRDRCADLMCFAQAWHWLAPDRRCSEAARVLRPGGRWAGWWSHARADGEDWFDSSWSAIEAACPGVHRDQRDIDWGTDLTNSGLFTVDRRVDVPWERRIDNATWLTDLSSHSYITAMEAPERDRLLATVRRTIDQAFPAGEMRVAYNTRLWIAHLLP